MARPSRTNAPVLTPDAAELIQAPADAALAATLLTETAPADRLRSAVEAAQELLDATATAAVEDKPALCVWSGYQYGCALTESGISLDLPALANGLPQVGDLVSVNPGDGFQSAKVKAVVKAETTLALELERL